MTVVFDSSMLYPFTDDQTAALRHMDAVCRAKPCFSEEELITHARDASIVKYLGWMTPFTRRCFENLPKLRAIVSHGVGYETIDIQAAKEFNVSVSNTPGYCAEEVSTTAVALLLSFIRRIPHWNAYIRRLEWGPSPTNTAGMDTLVGETIGIVGFGQIGRRIYEKLQGYSASFMIHDPYASITENSATHSASVQELLRESRYVILACPLDRTTHHLINRDTLAWMREDSVLINVSRGGLIDEKELVKALQANRIQGAALDVFEEEPVQKGNPLLEMDNVLLSPHTSACSPKAVALMGKLVFDETVRAVKGEPLLYRVA